MAFKRLIASVAGLVVLALTARADPKCERQLLENYRCNETDTVPHTLKLKWELFCQLSYCYKYENATDLLEDWERYSGLDSLFTPCDFEPFSTYQVAAIFVCILCVPIGIAFAIACEDRKTEKGRAESRLSVQTV